MTDDISGNSWFQWYFGVAPYLVEEGPRCILKEVGQQVQPSTVGHPNDDVFNAS